MEKILHVALDTTADPQVTVIPFAPTVSRHEKFRWISIANEDFKFVSLTPKNKTLHDIKLEKGDTEITATYDTSAKGQCDYTIVVRDANGDLHDTIPLVHLDTGGPTIKNK